MLTIICGEDSVQSRNYYVTLLDKKKKKGAEIIYITPSQLMDLTKGTSHNMHLFSTEVIYVTEKLESAGFRKSTKNKKDTIYESVVQLASDKTVELIDWEEDKSSRELKLKNLAQVKEFKPSQSIFSLLDACYPNNKSMFISALSFVCSTQEELFVFVMLHRHIRSLVLARNNQLPSSIPSWQRYKLYAQAQKWSQTNLLSFYEGLIKVEVSTKTSTNPFGIKKSLEILACYYL